MANIDYLRASDGTGNAAVATIQSVRSSGATTIAVDTVENFNTNFIATMGTPHTFVDPVTSETITVISESTAVDFKGHVDGGNLEIDAIAPGFTDAGSQADDIVIVKPTTQWADELVDWAEVEHNQDGTLKAGAVTPQKQSGNIFSMAGSDVTLTNSYQTVFSYTLTAGYLPGDGTYRAEIIGMLNINWGGNSTTVDDVYTRIYIDGVQTGVEGKYFVNTKPAVATYNVTSGLESLLTLSAGVNHTITVRCLVNNGMSNVICYGSGRSHASLVLRSYTPAP